MAYLLEPHLRIRKMREDRASGELSAARRAVAKAEDELEARRRDLAEFERTKEERRDRIYDAIIGRKVSRNQIDIAGEAIARIDSEGVLKADNVKRAQDVVREKKEAENVARSLFFVATKNRMKIDEHRNVWNASQLAESEYRAEDELEDFNVRKEEI